MGLQDIGSVIINNLPDWAVVVVLFILWWKERNRAGVAEENSLTSQVRVLSAAHEALLNSNNSMSRRFDEIEAVRAKERAERDLEREAETTLRCESEARIAVLDKTVKDNQLVIEQQGAEMIKMKAAHNAEVNKLTELHDAEQKARKALELRVASLESENTALKAENTDLRTKLEALEKRGTGPLPAPQAGEAASATVVGEPKESV